jgi:putative SOS response-associated peptidase YedK
MCGRFTMTVDPAQLQDTFPWLNVPEGMEPRYNIAPTQPVAVVPNNDENRIEFFNWGLIPSWAKDPSIGNRMINARAETLAEKPAFRAAYRRRRCLVLADGFFEWRKDPGKKVKQPMYIRLHTGEPFAFAGLWEVWNSADGSQILSCTIITTEPNELVSDIHNRMPVILPREGYSAWLNPNEIQPADLDDLLRPYPSTELAAYPVSTIVNSPGNDSPACVVPLTQE